MKSLLFPQQKLFLCPPNKQQAMKKKNNNLLFFYISSDIKQSAGQQPYRLFHKVAWYWLCLLLHYIDAVSATASPHIGSYYMNIPLGGVIAAFANMMIT